LEQISELKIGKVTQVHALSKEKAWQDTSLESYTSGENYNL
jgi:hypothetical protein